MCKLGFKAITIGVNVVSFGINVFLVGANVYLAVKEATSKDDEGMKYDNREF